MQENEESIRLLSGKESHHDGTLISGSERDLEESISFIPHDRIKTDSDELLLKELINKLTSLTGDHKLITYKAGKTIFREGDKGDSMYFLLDGVVEISQNIRNYKYVIAYLPHDS